VWKILFDERARKELRKLDPDTQERILKWLRKRIADRNNPRQYGKGLKVRMQGLWKYRIGSWRVICQIQDKEKIVFVVRIGHRRDIYE